MTANTMTESGAVTGRPIPPESGTPAGLGVLSARTVPVTPDVPLTEHRAARELGLARGEFDLAVRMGRVRTVIERTSGPEPPGPGGARRRVTRAEIDRLRGTEGFPGSLRAGLMTVSAPQGARHMNIAPARFTRLARLGLVVPVRFYVNRYRTLVWLYLLEELRTFAAAGEHGPLLTGRLPSTMRTQLDAGVDLRARNWRGRHVGFLLRLADGPWARAAATASLLDDEDVADVVHDPGERAFLAWLSPARPDQSPPGSPAALLVDTLLKAGDDDEIHWLKANLSNELAEARGRRPAPPPAPKPPPPKRPVLTAPAQEAPADPTRAGERRDRTATEARDHPVPRPRRRFRRFGAGRR